MADGDSWWFKLARAQQHLDDLDIEVARYANTYPYEVVRRRQPKHQKHLWTYVLRFTEPPHQKVPLLIGDAAHNMRTALDHLAVALSVKDRQRLAGFPIEDKPIWATDASGAWVIDDDEARNRYNEAVKGISDRTKAIIEGLQPYHRPEDSRELDPLHVIRVLDNADKHREIVATHPGLYAPVTILSDRNGDPDRRWFSRQIALCHDGEEVGIFNFSDIDPKIWPKMEAEMDVEVCGPLHVTLEVAKKRSFIDAPVELRHCLDVLAAQVVPLLEAEVGKT
jgi:hypothetical protein